MTPEARAICEQLRDDFPLYARKCLKIRGKGGSIVPFVLDKAQQYVHKRLEAQKAETGRVRALILKGRQQGMSTYIGGRFYHQTTHQFGYRTFILTHEQDATNNLFGMVERYHQHCPAVVKPKTSAANAKELFFSEIESGYAVGTAGTKAVGRSQTIQLLHGSEVAFWPHASTHFAGVVQAVSDLPGTEIILESTANGVGNEFHRRWQAAEAGTSDYIAVFVPWYWQDEYRKAPPDGFVLDAEEQAYQGAYGLDLEQMAWRRSTIAELGDAALFKQEYPATAAEAFQMTGHDSFIPPELIMRARKAQGVQGIGSLVLGVDPARMGDDRFAIAYRRGRSVEKVLTKTKLDNVAGANWVRELIDEDEPDRVFIDIGGQGAGVYDLLNSWGYNKIVRPVNFGGAPNRPTRKVNNKPAPGPKNKRAEMWMDSKEWLEDVAPVSIPDDDAIQADACAPSYRYDANQNLQLESKKDMPGSPDLWDAIALTFAEPVAPRRAAPRRDFDYKALRGTAGGWMT